MSTQDVQPNQQSTEESTDESTEEPTNTNTNSVLEFLQSDTCNVEDNEDYNGGVDAVSEVDDIPPEVFIKVRKVFHQG